MLDKEDGFYNPCDTCTIDYAKKNAHVIETRLRHKRNANALTKFHIPRYDNQIHMHRVTTLHVWTDRDTDFSKRWHDLRKEETGETNLLKRTQDLWRNEFDNYDNNISRVKIKEAIHEFNGNKIWLYFTITIPVATHNFTSTA